MKQRIWLSPPHLTGKEIVFLQETLDANWVTVVGAQIENFAAIISNYTQSPYVTLCNSGTSALHLALQVLGVKRGDFILTSTFTFVASVNPIKYLGAIPVLIESEKETDRKSTRLNSSH